MTPTRAMLSAFALAGLSACAPPGTVSDSPTRNGALTGFGATAPPDATPGSCWGKTETPAIIETVTDQTLLRPARVAADGTVVAPAAYRTETRQQIVRERQVAWFETPCPEVLTPDFIASLQRALAARGQYRSRITGEMDARTRLAIARYQVPRGLDNDTLSLSTARDFGLVTAPPDAQD
jgi:hypothetical protein